MSKEINNAIEKVRAKISPFKLQYLSNKVANYLSDCEISAFSRYALSIANKIDDRDNDGIKEKYICRII